MKLQLDANQQFQLDAVAAVTDLLEGQPEGAPEFSVINVGDYGGLLVGQDRTELGAGNRLLLAHEKLLANARGGSAAERHRGGRAGGAAGGVGRL